MNTDIMVSIICITYNHERYIKKAIEGFLNQKCSFNYEIIIHDDASTDNTANIIREYYNAYPDMIVPILEDENQYSRGKNIFFELAVPLARGKYIAFCEGDDYWTDENKLEKQIGELEKNYNICICAHAAYQYKNNKVIHIIKPSSKKCVFTPSEVIKGGGGFVASSSIVFRSTLFTPVPRVLQECPLDYFCQIVGSLQGGMLFLPDVMSAYAFYNKESWSYKRIHNIQFSIEVNNTIIRYLKEIDEMTNCEYHDAIEDRIWLITFHTKLIEGKSKEIIHDKILFQRLSIINKIKTVLNAYFPKIYLLIYHALYK